MSKKKTLHVPDAPFRPGDKPNFKDLNLPKSGEAEKPDISVDPSEIRDLAFSLVKYSYFSNGYSFGPFSFFDLIPTQ